MQNADNSGLIVKVLANQCSSGTCPTVYQTGRDTLLVQGYAVSAQTARDAGVDLPEGEQMVEIPLALLTEAVSTMERS